MAKRKYDYYIVAHENDGDNTYYTYREALMAFMRKGSSTMYGFNPIESREEIIRSK